MLETDREAFKEENDKEEIRTERELLDIKRKEQKLSKEYKKKAHLEERDIGTILSAFVNRQRFKYEISMILKYFFTCICLRCPKKNREKSNFKKHYLFQKAEDKFMNELDAIKIVKTLRKFKMLAQAMLSQKHKLNKRSFHQKDKRL